MERMFFVDFSVNYQPIFMKFFQQDISKSFPNIANNFVKSYAELQMV